MAKPLRLEYEGAFYHVTRRGSERGNIFFSEDDYKKFLFYLKEAKGKLKRLGVKTSFFIYAVHWAQHKSMVTF